MKAIPAPDFGIARAACRRPVAVLTLAGTLLAALCAVLAGADPAAAHAALTASDPKDGAVVATAPKQVTLTFSEQIAVGENAIRVLEPSGKRADTGEIREIGENGAIVYGVGLHSGLPDGTYTVAWQAVSADSHPVSGAFTFSIGAPSETTVALPEQTAGGGVVGALYGIARYASYAGFILLVGGAAFILACWPRGVRVRPLQRLVVHGWVTLTAGTLAMLLLRSPYTTTGSLGDAFDLTGLGLVLETKTGAALVSRLLLLGAAALFVAVLFGTYARGDDTGTSTSTDTSTDTSTSTSTSTADAERSEEGRTGRKDLAFGLAVGGTVVAAGIAATWALSEHASTGIQPGIAMPVDVLHLLAVAAWLGGLAALLTALYRGPAIERTAVRKFSSVALGSVVVLAVTGLYQSWRQVGSWSALTGTAYGQLLVLKVGLVVVLLGVAWISRRWTAQLAEVPADDTPAPGKAAKSDSGKPSRKKAAAKPAGGDVERAGQLARQRAAVATAQRKKERDADPQRSGLRRSVLTETGVAVVLLAVTTVLTSTEPGRTEEEAGAGRSAAAAPAGGPAELKLPFDTGGENGKGTLLLTLDPARSGANELHIWASAPDGKPLDAPEVKASFTLEDKQIGPLPVTPDRISAGHWSAAGVQVPMPGDWQLKVTVRTSDFDQTTVKKNVKIG
ncbi:copper resistance protein CopC [Streptomyces sp. HNM0663]|uniref:Copper resistance protein CopC n=1 Tax=Streptomyces chengmaiensis TaxID=3040919 RepID=A0ABT6HJM9_9ACTN|nr:copper resistance protein CopC [Streptomyces chengmaiensis]MDH2388269.1 copper resistance protein CopC [Streptomyces chengmaiensis]